MVCSRAPIRLAASRHGTGGARRMIKNCHIQNHANMLGGVRYFRYLCRVTSNININMLEAITNLLSNGLTVRQQDFVKSFIVIFPMVYCALDIYVPYFQLSDILTKCMYVGVFTVCLLSLSMILLWVLSRVEQLPIRNGVFYFIGPAVLNCFLFIDGARPNLFSGDCSAFVYFVFYNYFYFFIPFYLYGFAMGFARKSDKKRDEREKRIAGEAANDNADDEPK